jgi:hypothetical protein
VLEHPPRAGRDDGSRSNPDLDHALAFEPTEQHPVGERAVGPQSEFRPARKSQTELDRNGMLITLRRRPVRHVSERAGGRSSDFSHKPVDAGIGSRFWDPPKQAERSRARATRDPWEELQRSLHKRSAAKTRRDESGDWATLGKHRHVCARARPWEQV